MADFEEQIENGYEQGTFHTGPISPGLISPGQNPIEQNGVHINGVHTNGTSTARTPCDGILANGVHTNGVHTGPISPGLPQAPKVRRVRAAAAAPRARKDFTGTTWFNTLPIDSFLPEELALREGIFDFLASWQSTDLATLSHLEADSIVRGLCSDLFPNGVRLMEWMKNRIGSEAMVAQDGGVHLMGGAQQIVAERHREMNRKFPPPHAPASGWGVTPPTPDGEEFMPPQVKYLREALERARLKDPEAFSQKMTFADLKRKMKIIRESFNVREITHFGKKVGCDGPAAVLRRYCADIIKIKASDQERKRTGKNGYMGEDGVFHPGPDDEPEVDVDIDASTPEDFFKQLNGRLVPKEKQLTKALFLWMQKQPDSLEPLFIDEASADPDVVSAVEKLLSKCDVSLQDWIERRLANTLGVGLDEHDRCVLLPLVPLDQPTEDVRPARRQDDSQGGEKSDNSRPHNEFFNRLPHHLTEAEQALAEKLTWFDGIPLSQAQNSVNSEKEALLTEAFGESTGSTRKFPFKKWIEIRIIDYISLVPDSTGQPMIRSLDKNKRKMEDDQQAWPEIRKRPREDNPES